MSLWRDRGREGGGRERKGGGMGSEGERDTQGSRTACCVYYGNLCLHNTCGIKWLVCDHIGIIKIKSHVTQITNNILYVPYCPTSMLDHPLIVAYSLCQVSLSL